MHTFQDQAPLTRIQQVQTYGPPTSCLLPLKIARMQENERNKEKRPDFCLLHCISTRQFTRNMTDCALDGQDATKYEPMRRNAAGRAAIALKSASTVSAFCRSYSTVWIEIRD